MIFTTNKALSTWGHVLHDSDLAAAIIDRILERGPLLTLDGPSMRTRHLDLDGAAATEMGSETSRATAPDGAEQRGSGGAALGEAEPLARFSRMQRADFPELTPRSPYPFTVGGGILRGTVWKLLVPPLDLSAPRAASGSSPHTWQPPTVPAEPALERRLSICPSPPVDAPRSAPAWTLGLATIVPAPCATHVHRRLAARSK